MASTKRTPPPSPADLLEHLAREARESAARLLALANDAEALAKAFRGQG